MIEPNISRLAGVVATLDELDTGAIAQCVFADRADEAVLLATPNGLIALAAVLLRLALAELSGVPDSHSTSESGLCWTDDIKRTFLEHGEVWPVCLMTVPTAERYRQLIAEFAAAGALTNPAITPASLEVVGDEPG